MTNYGFLNSSALSWGIESLSTKAIKHRRIKILMSLKKYKFNILIIICVYDIKDQINIFSGGIISCSKSAWYQLSVISSSKIYDQKEQIIEIKLYFIFVEKYIFFSASFYFIVIKHLKFG